MSWEIRVRIFKDTYIIKQLAIAIGIPFGLLFVFLILIKAYYAVLIVLILLLLTYGVVNLIYKGTYDIYYEISDEGIKCQNQKAQSKRIKRTAVITFLSGLLSSNISAAAAGLSSGLRTKTFMSWHQVRSTGFHEKDKRIILYGGYLNKMVVYCNDNNYFEIIKIINRYLKSEIK